MKTYRPWLPALLWMGVIFFMSAATGEVSGEQSGRIVALLCAACDALGMEPLSQDALAQLQFFVRKAAHMAEYAVLAVLYLYALRRRGARRPLLTALALSALYAASDEFHQAFVPDRGPSPVDVMIDTAGAALGLAAARVACAIRVKFCKPTT